MYFGRMFNLSELASSGRPPRAEELVAAATQQQGLRAERLVELDFRPRFTVLLSNVEEPAAAKPSSPAGSWTTPSSETFSLTTILAISLLLSVAGRLTARVEASAGTETER
jgi:hypothetical protein